MEASSAAETSPLTVRSSSLIGRLVSALLIGPAAMLPGPPPGEPVGLP